MSRFQTRLNSLLDEAREKNVIDKPAQVRLMELAAEQEQRGGVLSLAAVLGWLGGGILTLGVILIISANWDEITPATKLIGFFTLFLAAHGGGVYYRERKQMPLIAEALNFLGAGLFLAGIGLISQIYQIDGRPSHAILIWFVAIAPLAWCFRSSSITLLSLFALLLWGHMEHIEWARLGRFSPAAGIMIEVGVGVALIGFAARLRDREPAIAVVFRGVGLLLLFGAVYILGFYRHMSVTNDAQSLVVPTASLILGAVGLAVGWPKMLPNNPALRRRLGALLTALLSLAGVMLLCEAQVIPQGPDLKFFNFGWYRTFHLSEWLLSIAAWVLWFALAFWCVAFATRTGRRAYLNAGVLGVGLGVLTRFFDLVGGLFATGLAFVIGGAALLATCFAVEYWRRRIVAHIRQSETLRVESKA